MIKKKTRRLRKWTHDIDLPTQCNQNAWINVHQKPRGSKLCMSVAQWCEKYMSLSALTGHKPKTLTPTLQVRSHEGTARIFLWIPLPRCIPFFFFLQFIISHLQPKFESFPKINFGFLYYTLPFCILVTVSIYFHLPLSIMLLRFQTDFVGTNNRLISRTNRYWMIYRLDFECSLVL